MRGEAIRPGMHILVVDDDPALRVLLRTTFELVETSVDEVGGRRRGARRDRAGASRT